MGNIFQNRLSFSVLVWLAVTINVALNYGFIKSTVTQVPVLLDRTATHLIELASPIREASAAIIDAPTTKDVALKAIPKNDLQCMAENIYYESATQSYAGKIAVGQVVLNRVSKPGFPNTICGVIYDGSTNIKTSTCQFSWTCTPNGVKPIDKSSAYWAESFKAAKELLHKRGMVIDITEGATSYHANYVKPAWSKSLKFVAQIDQHLFYK